MTDKKLVWDLPLRIFHWLFGLSIIGAWIAIETREEQLHIYIGYFIIILLIFRIFWGIWGTTHSQFRHFIPTPQKIRGYLYSLVNGGSKETVGHNPLGSLMAFLMLAIVALQVGTGLFLEGDVWSGPYRHAIESDTVHELENIHELTFSIIQTLIVIHIVAVLGYWLLKKQNLVLPMITGKKRAEVVAEGEEIKSSKLLLALVTLACVTGLVYWLIFIAPPPPPPPSTENLFLY